MWHNEKTIKRNNMIAMGLMIGMIMALLLSIEYFTMVHSKREQAYQTASMLIDQVRNVLVSNEKKEKALSESLREDYIAKAKAVSYIIDNVPEAETDVAELIRIANLMTIDEIHIFDETGRLYGGTIPPYYGYTFDSGEQMAYFKPMLENKALSMCQDVMPNTAEGKSMMYAICWNDAGTRMTEIGILPRRLIEEMLTSELADVIAGMPSYDGVDILVAHRYTGEIVGSTVSKQVGSTLEKVGIDLEGYNLYDVEHFNAVVSKRPSYCSASSLHSYAIVVVQERAEVNRDIPLVMMMLLVYLLLAAALLTFVVHRMMNRILTERTNANTDAMTGFFNRRAYETDIKAYDGGPPVEDLVYISADLNGLKTANDNFGHDVGDELICGTAECLREGFGDFGKLYRIGGDEFVALIKTDEATLETLREKYEKSLTDWSERHGRPISTACGYVRAAEFPEKSMTELAKMADQRMYAAKSEYYRKTGQDRRKR